PTAPEASIGQSKSTLPPKPVEDVKRDSVVRLSSETQSTPPSPPKPAFHPKPPPVPPKSASPLRTPPAPPKPVSPPTIPPTPQVVPAPKPVGITHSSTLSESRTLRTAPEVTEATSTNTNN